MATIELNADESLVLVEFLSRFCESEELKIIHRAEERVLWDLCAMLERQVPELFYRDYGAKLDEARQRVAHNEPA